MGNVVIDVMLKPEILDPQGQAVSGALPRLGFEHFTDVRQGKRFVLTVDGDVTQEHLAAARDAAERLLSNPVIEDVVSVRAEQDVNGVRAEQDVNGVRAEQDVNGVRAEEQ
jgi:phosphoribosylformylglycinamidine synthase subunit PurS